MATPLQTYFQRLNPIVFPGTTPPYTAAKASFHTSLENLTRQLFVAAPLQISIARTYIARTRAAVR